MFPRRYEFYLGFIAIAAIAVVVFMQPPAVVGDVVVFHTQAGNVTVSVEVAQTYEQLVTGLMNRPSLAQNSGMLFVFGQIRLLTFWMKDTLIPLDMAFISQDLRIVKIERNAPPCTTVACQNYGNVLGLYVVEVNAGFCYSHGIKEGDFISIQKS